MREMVKLRIAAMALALGLAGLVVTSSAQTETGKKAGNSEESRASLLSREIHHQLLVLPFYSVFDHIAFIVNGTSVTLTGQVVRPTLKTDAEAAVRSLDGVGGVVNEIEVLPASASDDELRAAIYRAIYEDPSLARYAEYRLPAIHILVKNGNVTLEGFVDSTEDKHVAGARASKVTASVRNNLIVEVKGSAGE